MEPVMAQRRGDLIPPAVRIALRNAVGGWGPFTVREIDDLFHSHEFTREDDTTPLEGGERRTEAERFHRRIDWTSPTQAQRYLNLVADVLDYYPEADDEPGSPGRRLRQALRNADLVRPDGRLRLPTDETRQVTTEPDVTDIWVIPDQPRLFMSHSSIDRADVDALAQVLEGLKFSTFVAHVDIEPSLPWLRTIERALRTCQVLVAYITPEFKESAWTDQEVGWVLGRSVPVIPVNAGLQPYGFFGSFQSMTVSGAVSLGHKIVRAIAMTCMRENAADDPARAALVARTLVRAFSTSPSYDSTRRRFPLLELIPLQMFTQDMRDELDMAADFNDQISEAGLNAPYSKSAPAAVADLLRRITKAHR